jgi:phosphate transport system substrate-binding protein
MTRRFHFSAVILVILAVLLAACSPAAAPAETQTSAKPVPATGSIQINGAGATFPLPVYSEWTYAYQYVDPSVAVNYQGTGSGGGKKAIIDGTVDFAGSDSLLKDEEYAAGKDLQMYPVLAGAVVPVYNITGLTADDPALILDGKTLVGIFNATIQQWNDPAIIALNPGLAGKLPAENITVVHRADGSGTTEVFTRALSAFSPDWTAGAGASIEWPVDKAGNGIGGKGNPGVAAAIQNTANSIGYVELSYALSNSIPFAQMINQAGQTVTANADSLASAMNDFAGKFDDQLTSVIVDAPGEGSWPIAAYTYLILHTNSMTDCAKAQKLLEYIRWTLTDESAGKRAAELGYAVLPDAVRTQVLGKLGQVTCSGSPVLPQ